MKLSVLMSVYNESENEISESIESILDQTYRSFEFIIVNDNPNREELKILLEEYRKKDNRIKIVTNKKNLGLAISLNKASNEMNTKIIVRMDADDISLPNRIEKQLSEINKGYDLIFSKYIRIDKYSKIIKLNRGDIEYYAPKAIHSILPIKNIIHHPTVMMTRDIFDIAGKYRNFPCAQDYDLWLRIYHVGGKFKMIDEPLLKYRVRDNSVSGRKRYHQKITLDYTHDLLIERVIKGKDSYSKNAYNQYLIKYEASNKNKEEEINYYNRLLSKAKESYYNGNYIKYIFYRIIVFMKSRDFRMSYLKKIRNKFILKNYIKNNLKLLKKEDDM